MKIKNRSIIFAMVVFCLAAFLCINGCGRGYRNQWLYPEDISSVYVEMFDSTSFRRGFEFDLTDAVAKRIEAKTPYKIVSDRNKADTILSGKIVSIEEAIFTVERQTGNPLEKRFQIDAVVRWKNLKTGDYLIDGRRVSASMSFSPFQDQSAAYASGVTENRLADLIVELMQKPWQ